MGEISIVERDERRDLGRIDRVEGLVYQKVGMRLGVSAEIHFQYVALQQDSGSPHGGSEGGVDSDRREHRGRCTCLEQYERIRYPR